MVKFSWEKSVTKKLTMALRIAYIEVNPLLRIGREQNLESPVTMSFLGAYSILHLVFSFLVP